MKRPTYILGRFYYPNKETSELKVAYIKNNLVFRWLMKYDIEEVALPLVDIGELKSAMPSFWGELRCYAFKLIYDTIQETFSSDFEDELCSQTAIFHTSCLRVEFIQPDSFDHGIDFVEWFAGLDFKELIQFVQYVKPEETEKINYFKRRIRYHYKWRRQMRSKEVCAFDNARDNEDDEFDMD